MKTLQICQKPVLFLIGLLLIAAYSLGAQPLNYTLRETIAFPSGTEVLAVRDMDGDGVLDIVLADGSAQTISVLERSGSNFVTRFTISEPTQLRGFSVHEVDGDGLPEILSGNRNNGRLQIWEASGDNSYALRYTEELGNFIENTVAGDTDGDGQREFLIARESFPSQLFILEATADNTYMNRGSLTGLGGNCSVAGVSDLDGDGAPETVFSDDQFDLHRGNLYVYENGSLVSQGPDQEMLSISLGDTDGNGLGEIIGSPFNETLTDDLRILESTGANDAFAEVFRDPSDYNFYFVLDVNQDGRTELWRQIDNGSGQLNIFTLANRNGSTITDIYNSGSLLQSFPDDIRNILTIGDTDNDGSLELAVVQGNQIHLLEMAPPVCVNPPSGLVSWWPGEDNANDIQSSNHGILQNGATFSAGKVGQAFSFDGINDYVRILQSSNLDGGSAITVEAWIKGDPSNPMNTCCQGIVGADQYLLGISNGGLYFAVGTTNGAVHAPGPDGNGPFYPISTGVFHHVAGTYDGSSVNLYVDGQLVASNPHSGIILLMLASSFVTIGSEDGRTICPSACIGTRPFKGLIDEVGIYNRGLSASEIQAIYNAGSNGKCTNTPPPVCVNPPSGLISWWPGENNGNDIQSSNHGALQSGVTFAAGKVGQAFSLDGADDHVSIPEASSLDLAPTSPMTIETWVFRTGTAPVMHILGKRVGCGPGGINYQMALDPATGYLSFGGDGGGGATGIDLPLNTWTYLAATFDGSSFRFYINGALAATSGTGMTLGPTNNADFKIGSSGNCAPFAGLIDEVSIYNRALTDAEIQSIYTAGSAGKCKECTPPGVSITGNESVCPNSIHTYAANTNAANPTFQWSVTGGTINGDNTGSSINVMAGGAGTMTVSVEVTDGATNCSNSVTQNVTVKDNQKPVITAVTNSIALWPPNHQYITINVSQCVTAVTDNCATLSTNNVIITKVTSDEPEDAKGGGDGNTLNDMVIASNCQSVQLRSEREGSGNGRVYTIHLSVSDGNGNTGTATCLVSVPKNQNGNPAINDGPVYTVTGSCNGSSAKLASVSSNENVETMTLPESYALEQNYPNPFNPSTVISFQLPVNGEVKLAIYSLTGQLVRELVNGEMNAGRHAISWDGRDHIGNTVAAGMYLYRLVAHGANGEVVFTQTRRMAFVK